MTTEEQKAISRTQKKIEPRYFMGTTAHHQMGDISRQKDDLFQATGETDLYWVGMWSTGFGFFNVLFPKETSRDLTEAEREHFNSMSIQIGSQPPMKLRV